MVLQRIWWLPGSEHPTVFLVYNLQAYDTFISYYLYLALINALCSLLCYVKQIITIPYQLSYILYFLAFL